MKNGTCSNSSNYVEYYIKNHLVGNQDGNRMNTSNKTYCWKRQIQIHIFIGIEQ